VDTDLQKALFWFIVAILFFALAALAHVNGVQPAA